MALKSAQPEGDKVDIEEALDLLDKTLDRTKVLYEQYFLGMQKQPPSQLHTDVERRLRELQQLNIRNTGLRYRFATLQQKFGSYNSYWRRTLRQIENGTYIRNLSKISRQAAMTGAEIPEEILAAMPKRMRDQVKRDREQALAVQRRREEYEDDDAAMISDAPVRAQTPMAGGAHLLGGDDDDFDIEAFFASVTDEKPTPPKPETKPEPKPVVQRATMPMARIAAATALPPKKAVPNVVEDEPTGVVTPRAPNVIVEDDTTGVVVSRTQTPTNVDVPMAHQKTMALPSLRDARTPSMAPPPQQKPPEKPLEEPAHAKTQAVPVVPPVKPPAVPKPPPLPGVKPAPRPTEIGVPLGPQGQPALTAMQPAQPRPATQAIPRPPAVPPTPPPRQATQAMPSLRPAVPTPATPVQARTQAVPVVPMPSAPSQQSKPNPIAPGSSVSRPTVRVESLQGPFPRTPPADKPAEPALRPPPGMNEGDVNALYAKYVNAKKMVGEEAGPGAYSKLMKTINAQAPKIMEQYKAKGVEFSVVVKDNQVIIKAKPKT